MVAVLQERENWLQPSALSIFFLSAVNDKFTEMVQISNGATFNAIFLKLDLLIVFF